MENNTVAILKKGEGRTVKAGGAWIYDNEIDTIKGTFKNGSIISVADFDGFPRACEGDLWRNHSYREGYFYRSFCAMVVRGT